MVTIKEREDSAQPRNKTNLKGIEDSEWIPYVFNFTQYALKKSCFCKAVRMLVI